MSLITIEDGMRIIQQKLVKLAPQIAKGTDCIGQLGLIHDDIATLHAAQLVLKRIEKEHMSNTQSGKMLDEALFLKRHLSCSTFVNENGERQIYKHASDCQDVEQITHDTHPC